MVVDVLFTNKCRRSLKRLYLTFAILRKSLLKFYTSFDYSKFGNVNQTWILLSISHCFKRQ